MSDHPENTNDNPESWVAWKRRALAAEEKLRLATAGASVPPRSLAVDDAVQTLELLFYGKTGNTFEAEKLAAIRAYVAGLLGQP
jgi:hypothetical protein